MKTRIFISASYRKAQATRPWLRPFNNPPHDGVWLLMWNDMQGQAYWVCLG